MSKLINIIILLVMLSSTVSCTASSIRALQNENDKGTLTEVTPYIKEYVSNTVKPIIDSYPERDNLSVLLKVSDILIDEEIGIHKNAIKPSAYIVYDMLEKLRLGFLVSLKLSTVQKRNLENWHAKYMKNNPADVFFAPSADDVIKNRAAFGCSHYARSFIAVVKALGLINKPENLRYVISCQAKNYNEALKKLDKKMTINGHQFVMANINSKWFAINTSKSEWVAMPGSFTPEKIKPPHNIPIKFASYPDVVFLLRRIGKDYNDDCGDNSFTSLMNTYRSGNLHSSDFNWDKFMIEKQQIISAR